MTCELEYHQASFVLLHWQESAVGQRDIPAHCNSAVRDAVQSRPVAEEGPGGQAQR